MDRISSKRSIVFLSPKMDSSPHPPNKSIIGDYEFGMGLSFGTILIIVIITCASWKCVFRMRAAAARRNSTVTATAVAAAAAAPSINEGLDEAALREIPKLIYSEAKPDMKLGSDVGLGCCSICLGDYKEDHMVRKLPYCGHLFHVECVDPWLRIQSSCPICRYSPMYCRQMASPASV